MSEGERTPAQNKSWLHSESADRTLRALRNRRNVGIEDQQEASPVRVVRTAVREISESVRRALQYTNDSDSDETPNSNVTVSRQFYFDEVDHELIEITESRVPSRLTNLTSVDSNFQLSDNEDLAPTDMAQNTRPSTSRDEFVPPPHEEDRVEDEIARLRHDLSQMRQTRASMPPNMEHNYSIINSQPGTLNLETALRFIPEFDGTSSEGLRDFLRICSFVNEETSPADRRLLLRVIMMTKLKRAAIIELEHKNIYTFEELKTELLNFYGNKRSIQQVQTEFSNVQQKKGENVKAYGARVEQLATELMEELSLPTYTHAQNEGIKNSIRLQAVINFKNGLNTERLRIYADARDHETLQEAISRIAEKERQNAGSAGQSVPQQGAHRGARRSTTTNNHRGPRQSTSSGSAGPTCFRCNRPGHYARECYSRLPADRNSFPAPANQSRVNHIEATRGQGRGRTQGQGRDRGNRARDDRGAGNKNNQNSQNDKGKDSTKKAIRETKSGNESETRASSSNAASTN